MNTERRTAQSSQSYQQSATAILQTPTSVLMQTAVLFLYQKNNNRNEWLIVKVGCCLKVFFYTPSPTLRSSSDIRMLKIQQYKRKTHGFRTFSCFGSHIWNSLPQDLRYCSTLSSFKAKLERKKRKKSSSYCIFDLVLDLTQRVR